MEIRNRQIQANSDSVSFMMSFVDTDVRRLLVKNYAVIYFTIGTQAQEAFSKEDVLFMLENLSQDLKTTVSGKYAKEIAQWGFNIALRRGYITQVAPKLNLYRLSEKIVTEGISKARKEGGVY